MKRLIISYNPKRLISNYPFDLEYNFHIFTGRSEFNHTILINTEKLKIQSVESNIA